MHLASRLSRVKPSPTLAVTQRAAELKSQGKDVIGLGAGEPDFPTPEPIRRAGIAAIESGQTRYTPVTGTPALKKAVSEKFARENGLAYAPRQVVVGCGAKQLIFNALLATLDPGDEVIIPAPYWVSYPDMVLFAEGTPVFVACPEAQGFKLSALALSEAITPKTKWLILNSPANPTGAAYTRHELEALAEVLLKHPHVMVLADDIYEHLVFDGFRFNTIAQVEPRLLGRTLTVNGVSKAYAMTGWRIGYAGGSEALISAMADIQSHSTSNPCSISQAAALEALTGPQAFLAEWQQRFAARRNLVTEALNATAEIHCAMPEGAFYVFPSMQGLMGKRLPNGQIMESSAQFCDYLLEEALVATVAGSAFGMEGHFRISYATSDELLQEAMRRIAKACAALK
ncbi:MAG: pyridoxal phosphate-dependent aminotransferase [Alphaproteobacteria bacterium]|nr:pyridoxal phosphate-dependent aminotransferase [Alphaproteobacteria bacterium]